jgi:hypothetical protein
VNTSIITCPILVFLSFSLFIPHLSSHISHINCFVTHYYTPVTHPHVFNVVQFLLLSDWKVINCIPFSLSLSPPPLLSLFVFHSHPHPFSPTSAVFISLALHSLYWFPICDSFLKDVVSRRVSASPNRGTRLYTNSVSCEATSQDCPLGAPIGFFMTSATLPPKRIDVQRRYNTGNETNQNTDFITC